METQMKRRRLMAEIRALCNAAANTGDHTTVALCLRALDGSQEAQAQCAQLIHGAEQWGR